MTTTTPGTVGADPKRRTHDGLAARLAGLQPTLHSCRQAVRRDGLSGAMSPEVATGELSIEDWGLGID